MYKYMCSVYKYKLVFDSICIGGLPLLLLLKHLVLLRRLMLLLFGIVVGLCMYYRIIETNRHDRH